MNFALCGQFWWPNQKYFYLKVVAHIRCHAYWIIYPFAILNSPKIEERGALFYEPNFPVFSNLEWFFWIMVLEELVTIFCPIIWSLMWFFDLLSEKIQKRPNSIFWLIECPHYTVNHYALIAGGQIFRHFWLVVCKIYVVLFLSKGIFLIVILKDQIRYSSRLRESIDKGSTK